MLCERVKENRLLRRKQLRATARTPDLFMYKKGRDREIDEFEKREENVIVSGRILPMILPQGVKINHSGIFKKRILCEVRDSKEKIRTAVINIKSLLKKLNTDD